MQKLLFSNEEELTKIVNVASVPQRSPFRYPGGKTWFVPRFRQWLASLNRRPHMLVEPFVGGGIISLTAAAENLVDQVLMVELDQQIAAVWQTVIEGDAQWLANRIIRFEMSAENASKVLNAKRRSTKEIAFQTIIKNRISHGGILAAGAGFIKKGESGKGIHSRWYPTTLARRFREIDMIRDKLDFRLDDAFNVISEFQSHKDAIFFIDPPYTAGGKKAGSRLYTYSELDHEALFAACSRVKGEFIMTYDNAPEVLELADKYNFQTKPIAMKNTHHAEMTELVVGRDLSWMNGALMKPHK